MSKQSLAGVVVASVLIALTVTPSLADNQTVAQKTPTSTPTPQLHTIRITGLVTEGITIQDTPVPTSTPTPLPTPTSTPEPPRQPAPVALAQSCGYSTAPIGYFSTWPLDELCTAISKSYCESRWLPWEISTDGAHFGLFQIAEFWFYEYGFDFSRWDDPYYNSELASLIVRDNGWGPWVC